MTDKIELEEVTEECFYSRIKKLNVTVTPVGKFPYKTEFRLKNGQRLVGIVQDIDYKFFLGKRYFLKKLSN